MENEFWINMLAYSHAMINPIIYIIFNENFKKSFKKLVCCSDEEITYEYSNRKFSSEVHPIVIKPCPARQGELCLERMLSTVLATAVVLRL